MSFILEALKRSENERQRKIGPSLADVHSRVQPSEKPWWAIAVGALLVVNLGVLLIVFLRNGDAAPRADTARENSVPLERSRTPPRNTSATVAPAPAPAPVQRAPSAVTDPSVRSLADEAGFDPSFDTFPHEGQVLHPNLAAAANVPEGPPIVRSVEPPAVAPAAVRPTYEPQISPPPEVLPTVRDLSASGTNLPEMHLDIHVHSPNPNERFVFVNMRKYIEGQALSEGPIVERITEEGVVLNQAGLRFLLPRQ